MSERLWITLSNETPQHVTWFCEVWVNDERNAVLWTKVALVYGLSSIKWICLTCMSWFSRNMLTTAERVEIILLCGREGYTHSDVAREFNCNHPEREEVARSTVNRLLQKFKATGSVADAPRSGRPSTSTAEIEETVLAKMCASPKKSLRRTSMEVNVPKTNVYRILKKHKFHPYKMQVLQSLAFWWN